MLLLTLLHVSINHDYLRCIVSYLPLHVVLLSCVCWFVVVQGFTALIVAVIGNKLSVVEILLQAGANVNNRNDYVGDGDVWDTTQIDMQYSLCHLTSLHFTSLQLVFMCSVLFCSVLVLVFHVHFHVHVHCM
jgi:ankyrin repeat protein